MFNSVCMKFGHFVASDILILFVLFGQFVPVNMFKWFHRKKLNVLCLQVFFNSVHMKFCAMQVCLIVFT